MLSLCPTGLVCDPDYIDGVHLLNDPEFLVTLPENQSLNPGKAETVLTVLKLNPATDLFASTISR
jgi:hypothetical protein